MDIGTGKDLDDYVIDGYRVPHHLIDIAEPGSEYNIFQYQKDFTAAFEDIISRDKLPVLCGGSGMYLEAVIRGYDLPEAPADPAFAEKLSNMDDGALMAELKKLKTLHSTTDTSDRQRMIRALEIEQQRKGEGQVTKDEGQRTNIDRATEISNQRPATRNQFILFGLNPGREEVRRRITQRLKARLETGMVAEVQKLIDNGVPSERLKAYGLEYKFITQYIEGSLSYEDMFRLLNTAIHQFAKRQMTWFRRMERQGLHIHWIESDQDTGTKVRIIRKSLGK
jgi:tRNA dimethylallyltransferase